MEYKDTNRSTKMIIAEIADENYFNNFQNIIRIKIKETHGTNPIYKYYDFPLLYNGEYPNPILHKVLIFTYDTILDKMSEGMLQSDELLKYPPGYRNEDGLLSNISNGYCVLLNQRIKNNVTATAIGDADGFNSDAKLASNKDEIRYSFSPSLNYDYTTTENEYNGNKNYDNIGIFITDNSVKIKSRGGEIVVGPDGISLRGQKSETHQIDLAGLIMKNPLAQIFPETLLTFPLSIKNIPNLNQYIEIGNSVKRIAAYAQAAGKVVTIIKNVV